MVALKLQPNEHRCAFTAILRRRLHRPMRFASQRQMSRIKRCIYCGPSLYGAFPEPLKGELWRPPAAQGDILREVLHVKPRQVVLIDGTFFQTLSVFHKELVFALLQGVVCIGAASMGALRAAEMHRYGMIGIGRIYERYRDGEEDDALVAGTFDPATYRPLVEPPVGNELKRADALEAIAFARSYKGKVTTTLTADSISPFFERIVMKTLEQPYVKRFC